MENTAANTVGATTLPEIGFVRLAQFVGKGKPIPVCTSTWWEWVRTGKAPQPVKLGPNMTAWDVQDIRALISELAGPEHVSA